MKTIFVFDLDGTLVDSDIANFYAYRDAIKEIIGIDIAISDGRFTRDKLLKLFPEMTKEQYQSIITIKERQFKTYLKDTIPNQKLMDRLIDLSQMKQETYLLTNSHKQRALEIVRYYHLEKYFTEMYFYEDYVGTNKYDFLYSLRSKQKYYFEIFEN